MSESAEPSPEIFQRLQTGRISGLIVDQIRVLLRDGTLSPGDRLPSERELCERFGVSRVTIREALRALEANGLITIKVGARGGAIITAPTSDKVGEGITDLLALSAITAADVTEARRVFELGFVPLACERANDADIAALVEICDRSDRALAEGTYDMALSAEFHISIARATHNAAIEMLARSFRRPMLLSLERARLAVPSMERIGAAEHRQFTDAVTRRDVQAATDILRGHLARAAEGLETAGDHQVLDPVTA